MNRMSTKLLTRLAGALLALGFASAAAGYAAAPTDFRAALDYGALFSPLRNDWQVFQADGRSLRVLADADCHNDLVPPEGLWLLTRDAHGAPELLAPSALPLPSGHSGRVTLLACDAPAPAGDGAVLRVPSQLLGWLANNTGAVYVGR